MSEEQSELRHTCIHCGKKRYERYMRRLYVYAGENSYRWECNLGGLIPCMR